MAALEDIGAFIREQRANARISLRQLSDLAGVSNPYLSQIERGLRRPSAAVLAQIATALRISTPVMYLRAGLLDLTDSGGVPAAVAGDDELTDQQKHVLLEIYQSFRRENENAKAPAGATQTDHDATDHDATDHDEPAQEA